MEKFAPFCRTSVSLSQLLQTLCRAPVASAGDFSCIYARNTLIEHPGFLEHLLVKLVGSQTGWNLHSGVISVYLKSFKS